jgi:DNA-binding CsgD family transcriptional regulator
LAETAQGLPGKASQSLREAIAALENDDIFRLARCFHGALASAMAIGGDGTQARAWLDRATRLAGPAHRLFGPWFRLWEAWTLASEGNTTAAAMTCRQAAEIARAADLPTVEATACYDAVRLGGPAEQERLGELANRLGTPFTVALATAARGIGAADGDTIAKAGETFTALGHHLLATEALIAASRAYRQAGKRTCTALSMERAVQLRARCRGAKTPMLDQTQLTTLLTRRERDVALLAATHSSRQIAEQLKLSLRTVNNNLARVYVKLGISSRAQLSALLDGAGDP